MIHLAARLRFAALALAAPVLPGPTLVTACAPATDAHTAGRDDAPALGSGVGHDLVDPQAPDDLDDPDDSSEGEGEGEGEASEREGRWLVAPGLADPDVLKVSDDAFFLSGTLYGSFLPIYESTDLRTFTEKTNYDPSAVDPNHNYCHIWAPDLARNGSSFELHFSAVRVAEGAGCPAPGLEVATFVASAPDAALAFGAPSPLDFGGNAPRTRPEFGCPANGCDKAIRIDSAITEEGARRWLHYVYFDAGNNIASIPLDQPTAITHVARAAGAVEEGVNEGPDIFFRDGRAYLFFSHGNFNTEYAMSYIMGPNVAELTRARAVRRHSRPLHAADGRLLETHGHNCVVERNGKYYNVFHRGEFNAQGQFTGGRSTWIQPLHFHADGSLVSHNTIDLRWGALPGASYSLDVQLVDGTWIGPCLSAAVLGQATSATFNEVCTSAGDRVVHKDEIQAFRLYHSTDGTWSQHAEQAYDGVTDRVFIDVAGATARAVELHWNELQTNADYSVDVQRADGSWVAPCVGANVLGHGVALTFDGTCSTAGTSVDVAGLTAVRVCSAQNGDWAHAVCGTAAYDGVAGFVDVAIP